MCCGPLGRRRRRQQRRPQHSLYKSHTSVCTFREQPSATYLPPQRLGGSCENQARHVQPSNEQTRLPWHPYHAQRCLGPPGAACKDDRGGSHSAPPCGLTLHLAGPLQTRIAAMRHPGRRSRLPRQSATAAAGAAAQPDPDQAVDQGSAETLAPAAAAGHGVASLSLVSCK